MITRRIRHRPHGTGYFRNPMKFVLGRVRRNLCTLDDLKDSQNSLTAESDMKSSPRKGFFSTLTVWTALVGLALVFVPLGRIIQDLRRWYSSTGEFYQQKWNLLLDAIGDDPSHIMFYGTVFVFFGFYWFVGVIYTLLDVLNRPEALRRYKVQPGTNEPVDSKRLLQVFCLVLFNQTVVSIPVIYACVNFLSWLGHQNIRQLPSLHWAVLQIIGCVFIEEIAFYYSHRLLHHKKIYKYIHKKHHEWTAPIAIVAIYAHPFEHVVSNLLPPFLGVLIFKCHPITSFAWFALAIVFTLGEHSGYHMPLLPSPEAHDYHHLKYNNCYGVLGLLDTFHGTNAQFKAAVNYERHRILTSFKSMHELYPSPKAKNE